ncbi:hypothetical protein RZS08_48000, partial [Arthrospira platensis SPKY1]|nr:hypothetical protein [Arthrospira platensis SPKY1]
NKKNWQAAKEELADAYLAQGLTEEGLFQLDGILRCFPWRVDVLEKKAAVLNETGRPDLALLALRQANSQLETAFNTKIIGALLLQSNRLDEGLPYLERAYRLNPNDPQNLYNLSGAYALKKDFVKSFEMAERL